MNPGPIEEGADVAKEAVGALRGYPVLLTLVLLQIVMLAAVAWSTHERTISDSEEFKLLLTQCGPRM